MKCRQVWGEAAAGRSDLLQPTTTALLSGPKGGLGCTKGGLSAGWPHLISDNFAHPGSPAIFLDQFKISQVSFFTWVGPTTAHNSLQSTQGQPPGEPTTGQDFWTLPNSSIP